MKNANYGNYKEPVSPAFCYFLNSLIQRNLLRN